MVRLIPNILTGLRIALVPAFVAAFAAGGLYPALIMFVLAEVTDVLDGFIARRFNCVSKVGKALDPLADKITLVGVLCCLYIADRVPLVLLLLIATREVLMIVGGIVLWRRRVEFASDKFGKVNSVLFFAATALLFPWHSNPTMIVIGEVLMVASLFSSLTAFGHYTKMYYKKVKKN